MIAWRACRKDSNILPTSRKRRTYRGLQIRTMVEVNWVNSSALTKVSVEYNIRWDRHAESYQLSRKDTDDEWSFWRQERIHRLAHWSNSQFPHLAMNCKQWIAWTGTPITIEEPTRNITSAERRSYQWNIPIWAECWKSHRFNNDLQTRWERRSEFE